MPLQRVRIARLMSVVAETCEEVHTSDDYEALKDDIRKTYEAVKNDVDRGIARMVAEGYYDRQPMAAVRLDRELRSYRQQARELAEKVIKL